jgi:CMP-N,N'-diacetyllegionaminic acid synthase
MYKFPRILGLIPARGGSKGVPGKNIKPLAGQPLILYTINSALESILIDTVAVSTDSQEIADYVRQFRTIKIPFIRPEELALDQTPSIAVIQHAVAYYEYEGEIFDYVCLLQPTTPIRSKGLIDRTILEIIRSQADSLVTIRKIPEKYNPYWALVMDKKQLLHPATDQTTVISRRQDLPDAYHRDGKIYITKTDLIKQGILLGGNIAGFVSENEPDINIDTYADWEKAEKWAVNAASR